MANAIAAGASDLAMVDIMKIGGVTGWLSAMAQAEAAALPLSNHTFVEPSAHVMTVSPMASWFEYLDIAGDVLTERLLPVDGTVTARGPGRHPGDGLPAGEGAFLACSFWLVDNYILQGRYAEARKLFTRLLSRCNDVGLLAEEFDPLTGRMLGNFPQAYSQVGLINCALDLSQQKGPDGRARRILSAR